MRDVVINFGEEMYRAFGELLQTVRTGETAFDAVFGASLFEYYATNPQAQASAAAPMRARTLPVASKKMFAASDVLCDARTLVDVGGGTGTLLAAVLRHSPTIGGVLLHLVRHRTTLKNRIQATLMTFGHPCLVSDLFGHAGRELLDRLAIPDPWRRPSTPVLS